MGNKPIVGSSALSGSNASAEDLKRVVSAIKNLAGSTELLTKEQFLSEVFGGFLPLTLGSRLFEVFGGTKKGISVKDLVDGLSIFISNDRKIRAKFVFRFYLSDSNAELLYRDELYRRLRDDQGTISASLQSLFLQDAGVDFLAFLFWVKNNPDSIDLYRFLNQGLSLTAAPEKFIPSFHQVISGITHFSEDNVASLERTFWQIVNASPSRQFDCSVFSQAVSPPLSPDVSKLLFLIFDDRKDGVVDLRELAAGISACCYGPVVERTKFIFRLFDVDEDNVLREDELDSMLTALLKSQVLTKPISSSSSSGSVIFLLSDIAAIRDNILSTTANLSKESSSDKVLTLDQFLQWTMTCSLHQPFLELLYQVCHVAFGVKPDRKTSEMDIIFSYLKRCDATEIIPGDVVYLIPMAWWSTWCHYVGLPVNNYSKYPQSNNNNLTNKPARNYSRSYFQSSKQFYESAVVGNGTVNNNGTTELSLANLMKHENLQDSINPTESKPVLRMNRFAKNGSPSALRSQQPSSNSVPSVIDPSLILLNFGSPNDSNKICLTNDSTRPLKYQLAPFKPGYGFEVLPPSIWLAFQSWYGLKANTMPISRRVVINSETSLPEIEYQPVKIIFIRQAQPVGDTPGSVQATNFSSSASSPLGFGSAAASFVKSVFGATSACAYPGTPGPYTASHPISTISSNNSNDSLNHTTPANLNKYYEAAFGFYSRCHTVGDVMKTFMNRFHLNPDFIRIWHLKSGPIANGKRTLIWQPGDGDTTPLYQAIDIPFDNLNVLEYRILIEVSTAEQTWPEDVYLEMTNEQDSPKNQDNHSVNSNLSGSSTVGLIGFKNLGNTCFLNAALQCLSNTPPLTRYFLRSLHLRELNMANPLGFHGLVALRYAELIETIWSGDSPKSNMKPVSPAKIKNLIAKTWNQYGDNEQQDATELMTFLLDGLHEDLNRKRRPGVINGNGDYSSSPEQPKLKGTALAWNNHLKMNDSIVVDIFHGLLSSEICCPRCKNASKTYDPFNYLVLPMPIDPKVNVELTVISSDTSHQPLRIAVRVPASSPCSAIYQQSGKTLKLAGSIENRFLLAEIAQASIIRFYGIGDGLGKIFGELVLYEIISEEDLANMKSTPSDQDLSNHYHFNGEFGSCQEERCKRRFGLYDQLCVPAFWRDRFFVVINRQLHAVQNYILPQLNWRPQLFGRPYLIPIPNSFISAKFCNQVFEHVIYDSIWERSQRFLTASAKSNPKSAIVPNASGGNYARDGDFPPEEDKPFPFELSRVCGPSCMRCSRCPWYNFCRGCLISFTPESDESSNLIELGGPFLAIDWDPRTIFLFFRHQLESAFQLDNSVEICRQKSIEPLSLYDCLSAFAQQEPVDGYVCEQKLCSSAQNSEKVTASSHMSIARLPPMLIVHLKRFFMARDGRWMKSSRKINVPIVSLNLADYLARDEFSSAQGNQYKLYAAVCHYGAMRSGHYVTYARHQPSGVWYFFDDTSVREVQPSEIDMSAVYLLFYERAAIDYDELLPHQVSDSQLPQGLSTVEALRTAEEAEEQRLAEAKARGIRNTDTSSGSNRCSLQ